MRTHIKRTKNRNRSKIHGFAMIELPLVIAILTIVGLIIYVVCKSLTQ